MMRAFALTLALLFACGGCLHAQRNPVERVVPDPAVRRARALERFAHASLFKPSADSAAHDAYTYAPIIVHELVAADGAEPSGDPDALVPAPGEDAGVSLARGVVYAGQSHAELFGERYTQWVYCWWYGRDDEPSEAPHWRWLRVTLDRDGFPQVWETLSPGWDRPEVYVSRRIEELAKEQYGAPAEGRDFAIERPRDDASADLVVRVLNDGPVPMGPFVYLDRDLTFTSVLCRCMASQVDAVDTNDFYDLLSASGRAADGATADTLYLPPRELANSPRLYELADPRYLENALRLPGGF